MKRRQFLGLLGAAATQWPVRANARKAGGPAIGFLQHELRGWRCTLAHFHGGLNSTGFVKDQNVRSPTHGRMVIMLSCPASLAVWSKMGGRHRFERRLVAANAAVDATARHSCVFWRALILAPWDSEPQTNVTGIVTNTPDQLLQRLEALRNLVPGRTVALLVNPANSPIAAIEQPKALLSGVPIPARHQYD